MATAQRRARRVGHLAAGNGCVLRDVDAVNRKHERARINSRRTIVISGDDGRFENPHRRAVDRQWIDNRGREIRRAEGSDKRLRLNIAAGIARAVDSDCVLRAVD